jgi:hypothetical protein
MSIVRKSVAERFPVGFRYTSDKIDAGQTISSCVVAITPTGLTAIGSPVISSNIVTQAISGGTSHAEYSMVFTTTLSDATVYTDEIVIIMK